MRFRASTCCVCTLEGTNGWVGVVLSRQVCLEGIIGCGLGSYIGCGLDGIIRCGPDSIIGRYLDGIIG